MGKCCSGFGHRNFYPDVYALLRQTISQLVATQDVTTFLTGGMGDFDALFCRAVREIKARNKQIKLILVKPYFSYELNTNKEYYNAFYDDVIIPDELLGVYYKSAIQKRNRWMVDRSDIIISGVYRDFGGAYQTIQYAFKSGKKVIDIVKKYAASLKRPQRVRE